MLRGSLSCLLLTCPYCGNRLHLSACSNRSTPHLPATSALLSRSCQDLLPCIGASCHCSSSIWLGLFQSLASFQSHRGGLTEHRCLSDISLLMRRLKISLHYRHGRRCYRCSHPHRLLYTPFTVQQVAKITKLFPFLYAISVYLDTVSFFILSGDILS